MRFREALLKRARRGYVPVIPDFKMISPLEGALFEERNVLEAAKEMEKAGAPALSVVTEHASFGGSVKLLSQIVEAVRIPVLRKDFIRTKKDVEESMRMGASAILLIASCMEREELAELYHAALDLGIEPLVETHSEEELQFAAKIGAKLVGINNRNILELECDGGNVTTTLQLVKGKPEGAFLISESGLQSAKDVNRVLRCGADAVLMGTAIWKAENPYEFYRELSGGKL